VALVRCVQSFAGEDNVQVIVVDNGAGGPEIQTVEQLEGVELVSPGRNLGYAAGSNLGAEKATGDVLVFLNPDTVARPGALSKLAGVLDDPKIGAAMPRLLLLEEPELLNSDGNVLHFTGLAWVGGHGRPVGRLTEPRDIAYASGAALAIRAELFREVSGFTEELFLYHEDVELGWRVRMRGMRVVVAPGADMLHDYEFSRNPRKHYFLERNRLVFVVTSYSSRLLALVAPVLVALELAVAVRALREGWLRQKFAGWAWCFRHVDWIRRHRRETQALRRASDRELAPMLTPVIDPGMMDVPTLVAAMNPLMRLYWSLARRLL
jgi:GT2 family glycosyltransferase